MNPTSPRQPPSSTSRIRSQAGQPMRTPSHPPPLEKWRGPWSSGRVRTQESTTALYLMRLADSFEHTRRWIDERRRRRKKSRFTQWRSNAYRNCLLKFVEQILQFGCLAIWGLSVQLPIHGSLKGWWSIRRIGAFAGSNSEGDGFFGKWFIIKWWFFCARELFLGLHSACQIPGLGTTVLFTHCSLCFWVGARWWWVFFFWWNSVSVTVKCFLVHHFELEL